MIYLYTLPGVELNLPQFSNCLIKGYLKNKKIEIKHIDLSAKFLKHCLNLEYIRKHINKKYMKLNVANKKTIDKIDEFIVTMKSKNKSTDEIISANDGFRKVINIFAGFYDIEWHKNGIGFKHRINTVDDLLRLSYEKNNKIFDFIFSKEIAKKDKDIIILSVKYPYQMPYTLRYAKMLKESNASIKIIICGDYPTHILDNCKEIISKCEYIDGISFYNNPKTLLNLINYFNGKNIINIPNTIVRNDKNKIICNNIAKTSIDDIDDYIPSYDDINLNDYLSNVKLIPLTLTYGCYHAKCNFCSRHHCYETYHKLNIYSICELIKTEYRKNHIEAIYFVDECVPPLILKNVSKYLIKNNIKIKWIVETRIEEALLENNLVKIMYDSGCREISFGIESYNKRILKDMNKNIDLKIAKKVMKKFYLNGIVVSGTFMVNYPTEVIVNTIKTLNFIKNFKYMDAFGLANFKYMRNSNLVNSSGIDFSSDLNLIYVVDGLDHKITDSLVKKFYANNKIKRFINIRDKILYRTEYLYLDREKISLNYKNKAGDNMKLFRKIEKKKDIVYLKELKPEMTQCRVVQVEKKIKEKSKNV